MSVIELDGYRVGIGELNGTWICTAKRDSDGQLHTAKGTTEHETLCALPETVTVAVLGLGVPVLLQRGRGGLFWPSVRMGREQYELNQENGANPPWH